MSDLAGKDEVLAVAVSFERVVEDGQRLSFGTAFAEDMPRAQKNRILDELADLAARQAARARKPKVQAERRKHAETLAQFEEDAGRAEANWPTQQQALVDAIAEADSPERAKEKLDELQGEIAKVIKTLQERRNAEYNEGLEEFRKSGRVADYKPRGHREVNLSRMDAEIAKAKDTAMKALEQLEFDRLTAIEAAKETLAKAEAERTAVIGNYAVSVQRYTKAIEGLDEELAEIDRLLED